jgi:large subunit ribosomal protein L4
MATIPVYDKTGSEIGSYQVETSEIAPNISKQLLHDAVLMYQANRRQGSAKTKSRAEVAAARQKMYRQKGTGHARAGHRTSGIRRGGGHIFAKRPKDWSYRLPRKALQKATRMALATKIDDEQVLIIDQFEFDAPKTKEMAQILEALKLRGTVLVTTEENDANAYRSARNIPGVNLMPVREINAYELLKSKRVLFTKSAIDAFLNRADDASE